MSGKKKRVKRPDICQFAEGKPNACTEKAVCKFGDHWFCREHGDRGAKNLVMNVRGREFVFNDHVYAEMITGPEEKRSGRLVQVRKRCGQFGSHVYLVRLRDGSLITWENVLIRHVDDERFVDAFYLSNGEKAPIVPPQPIDEDDSTSVEYTIGKDYPETGFIIENPKQPETHGCFSVVVTKQQRRRL